MKTRKEIKEDYKLLKPKLGVYQIRNLQNGKVYIASSINLGSAENSQLFQLGANSHPNSDLQKDWQSFGAGNFTFEILHELKAPEDQHFDARSEVKALETMVIEDLQPFGERGYNMKK